MTSKTSETYKLLKTNLLNCVFKPGAQLRIDAISKSLDVSVGAVREALSRLTSDGLVENVPQKGFIVAPVSAQDLRDLTNARIYVECRCLELAINRGDLDWEGRVLSAYHRLSKTPIETDAPHLPFNLHWTVVHEEFHDSLISACDNNWLLKLKNMMHVQAERYRRMTAAYTLERRNVDAEHKAIMEAALNRNSALACELYARHLETTLNIILSGGFLAEDAAREELDA
ncbi:GntR family transcriptional regulator [Bradyrhizobium tropiciagri]|uniref:GntR family transcriptional regulator n=1 Tax=Bradyrhizobium tropiciagri TaxID=312253 RepID=UPI00067CA4D4|nr:FCD domain-containing protein [Bradyrhizobium tropiciagri]